MRGSDRSNVRVVDVTILREALSIVKLGDSPMRFQDPYFLQQGLKSGRKIWTRSNLRGVALKLHPRSA